MEVRESGKLSRALKCDYSVILEESEHYDLKQPHSLLLRSTRLVHHKLAASTLKYSSLAELPIPVKQKILSDSRVKLVGENQAWLRVGRDFHLFKLMWYLLQSLKTLTELPLSSSLSGVSLLLLW